MSLDDLLPGLLFILFVVMPIISRFRKGGSSTGTPTGQPAPRPPRPVGQAGPAAPTGQGQYGPPIAGPGDEERGQVLVLDPEQELARRLAEARDRVQRAMASASSRPAAGAQPVPPAPTVITQPRSLVSAPPSTVGGGVPPHLRRHTPLVRSDRDDGLLSTPLEPVNRPVAPRPTGRRTPLRERARSDQSAALQVEHLGGPIQVAKGRGVPTWLEEENIRQGFIWHQVLGESKARQRMRSGPSPRR